MATSTLLNDNLKTELIWTNPSPTTEIDNDTITISTNKKYRAVVICFYQNTTAVYLEQYVFIRGFSNSTRLITSVRWDGNLGAICGRTATYNFSTNELTITRGYAQNTYGTWTVSNSVLIPYQVIGIY